MIEDILRLCPHATVQFPSLFPLAIHENRLDFPNSKSVIQPIQRVPEPIQLGLLKSQQGFVRSQPEFAAHPLVIAGNQPVIPVSREVFRRRESVIERPPNSA